MFHRILVLLDGSQRAELALPVATRLARSTGASLSFLRLVPLPADAVWYQLEPPYLAQTLLTTQKRNASTYLKCKAWEMDLAGIPVQTHMLPALPTEQLHTFINDQAIDLVVMCSRGQIFHRPRTQRSMAQQVIQQSPVPVLILQETAGTSGTVFPRATRSVRLMVPLDGSALAEAALAPAAFLSAALSAPEQGRLSLVRALPLSETIGSSETTRQIKEQTREHAQAYLRRVSQKLHKGNLDQLHLSVSASVLFHADIMNMLQLAESTQSRENRGERCDIIALTLSDRSGLCHEWMGSISERILQEAQLPFLIVPPPPAHNEAATLTQRL